MSVQVSPPRLSQRNKLGLSLAGGGFRASLFHLGVLRRLAEMDVLRYVEVLSTVSGGSIVGALYILMLKGKLDQKPSLSRDEYVDLIKNLEKDFVGGIKKDLRTRLLMNPLGMLSVLISHDGLGRRMGRIYQRYLYAKTIKALGLRQANPLYELLWPGWIPLRKVQINRPMPNGIDAYNTAALARKESAIPNFILNATSLNSGTPFRLSSIEIGDARLGYFRHDEINLLLARKQLLEQSSDNLTAMAKDPTKLPEVEGRPLQARDATLAKWWLACKVGRPVPAAPSTKTTPPADWDLFSDMKFEKAAEAMCKTNFGRLRELKLPAWYVRIGQNLPSKVTGGLDEDEHRKRFNQVLKEVEPKVDQRVLNAIEKKNDPNGNELLDFAIEIYYLRSAEMMSWRLQSDFDSISLGTAVAASANFPPVFPPLMLLGIYDDIYVSRLGLSDGGVYDNMGITTLLEEGCTHIIASDTGAPFDVRQRVSSRYIGMIGRLPDILMEDVAEKQRMRLRERASLFGELNDLQGIPKSVHDLKMRYGLEGLAFFSIDSLDRSGGYGIALDADPLAVACLRTDLDAFGDMEITALTNTGYDHADQFLQAYLSDSPYRSDFWNGPPPTAPYTPSDRYKLKVSRVLQVGQSHLFRPLLWMTPRSIPSWLFLIILIGAVLWRFGDRIVSVRSFVNGIPAEILNRLENPFPLFTWLETQYPFFAYFAFLNRLAVWLVNLHMHLWVMLGLAGLVTFAIFGIWPWFTKQSRKKQTPRRRKIVTFLKWTRAFAPALFLLAGLTPVWIALAACVVGFVSYLFFTKPYLWATRMQ